MSVRSSLSIFVLALVACTGGGDGAAPDASKVDAQTAAVLEVTCPTTPDASFLTTGYSFTPSAATIRVGQIAKLESNSLDHPIGPFNGDPSLTDPALLVQAGHTKCFQFLRAGTFKFICSAHFYVGTITVM